MSEKSFEVKVGIFILFGIVVLFIMIFSIGDIYLIQPGYRIKVLFNFSDGIARAAPVRLAGVEVGQIDGIRVYYDESEKKTKVELEALIKDRNLKVEKDALVIVNMLGPLGEKYLEIFPGTGSEYLKDGDTIAGKDPVSLASILYQIKDLADASSEIMEGLNTGRGSLGKFLTDDRLYNNFVEFSAEIKKNPWKLLKRPRGEE